MQEPFRAYDVRGVVGDTLTPGLAKKIGARTATFLDASALVVGRDVRPSGKELSEALIEGIQSVGVDVIDIGNVTTPTLYFAIPHLRAHGGIMVTASHNPPRYNGFKICDSHSSPIDAETGLETIAETLDETEAAEKRGTYTEHNVNAAYTKHVLSFVDREALRERTVWMDGGNGAAGLIASNVFNQTPCNQERLYLAPDGTFPNHEPNPMEPKNTVDLRSAVRSNGADAGFAWDGDADRFFLVDEKGAMVAPDTLYAYIADHYLKKRKGALIQNALCGAAIQTVAKKHGVKNHVVQVGHGHMKRGMRKHDAVIGGEHSGHYYFQKNNYADDGMIPALLVYEAMSKTKTPLSEQLKPYRSYSKIDETNYEFNNRDEVIQNIKQRYNDATIEEIDGVTIRFEDAAWLNVRKSNSEPLLRLNIEAPNQSRRDALFEEVNAVLKEHGEV